MACNVDFLAMIGDADNKPDDEEIFDKVRWQSNVTIFLYYTLILGLPSKPRCSNTFRSQLSTTSLPSRPPGQALG